MYEEIRFLAQCVRLLMAVTHPLIAAEPGYESMKLGGIRVCEHFLSSSQEIWQEAQLHCKFQYHIVSII